MHPFRAFLAAGIAAAGLACLNCGGSSSAPPASTKTSSPTAAFETTPLNPTAGQTVQFSDTSTGSPTSWAWSFGDGGSSTLQNPSHTFTTAGTFTVSLTAGNASGSNSTSRAVMVSGPSPGAFRGNIVLGAPTATSIKINVLSPDQGGTVSLQYGTAPGTYGNQTPAAALQGATPTEIALVGLAADTRHYYRLVYQAADGSGSGPTAEYSFHTARPAGSTFTFTVQADSHMDENSNPDIYRQALGNVLADAPDFHVDLGDTFMCEKHSEPLSGTSPPSADQATVNARYRYERGNFGIASHSVPLFLVNGNHEGETGWLRNGTAQNLAVWTTLARLRHFPAPFPDGFFGGDASEEPFIGKRASWYAWQWGDAHFIVLDPFWNTTTKSNTDGWVFTLGDRQYQWLKQTLSSSTATFRFIFIHNLVGGLDGQMRGGVEAAPYFEWGGRNLDGTVAFAQKRPGWSQPIHPLLVQYGVTAVFHGHDHLYARQELDGVVYQEVPQPSAVSFSSGPSLATAYHYASGTVLSSSGHIRVRVSPGQVTAEYVRTWLPANETAQRKNGQVDHTWSVAAPAKGGAQGQGIPAGHRKEVQ